MAENKTLRPRPSIFRRTDAGVPEREPPAACPTCPTAAGHMASQAFDQRNPQPADHPTVLPARPPRIKATFYLTADDIIAIDTMQTAAFRRTGKKPERSELVSHAIQDLLRHRLPPASGEVSRRDTSPDR